MKKRLTQKSNFKEPNFLKKKVFHKRHFSIDNFSIELGLELRITRVQGELLWLSGRKKVNEK